MHTQPEQRTTAVRELDAAELDETTAEHSRHLSHGFFADLGPDFLRTYHRTFVDSPHGIALAAEVDGRRTGVLVGTLGNRLHYGWVLRHAGLGLLLRGAGALLLRPAALWRLLRTRARRYSAGLVRLARRSRQAASSGAGRGRVAVLTHMWTAPEARGAGVGTALVEAFLDRARTAGVGEAQLVTLAGDRGAGGFYERLGWEHRQSRRDADGRLLHVYALRMT